MYWEYTRRSEAASPSMNIQQQQPPSELEYVPGKPQHMVVPQPYVTEGETMSAGTSAYPYPAHTLTNHPFFVGPSMFIDPYVYYSYPYRFYPYPY